MFKIEIIHDITDGRRSERYGVCSNYLESLNAEEEVQIFLRSANNFHLPANTSSPVILIGPGKFVKKIKQDYVLVASIAENWTILITFLNLFIIFYPKGTGTAPFRSFWQEFDEMKLQNPSFNVPKVWLFFGCRTRKLDLYKNEKELMLARKILDSSFLALSRETDVPKVRNFTQLNNVQFYLN